MGYRSNVALALTSKGVSEMNMAIANLDKQTHALVTDFLDYTDRHALDLDSKSEAYCWDGVKWYYGEPDIDFFENFMRNLDHEDFRFIRIGNDYDDTEVRGGFTENPFDMELARGITFDNSRVMQVA